MDNDTQHRTTATVASDIAADIMRIINKASEVRATCAEEFLSLAYEAQNPSTPSDQDFMRLLISTSHTAVTGLLEVHNELVGLHNDTRQRVAQICATYASAVRSERDKAADAERRAATSHVGLRDRIHELEIKLQRRCEDPTHDKAVRAQVLAMNDGCCIYCDAALVESAQPDGSDRHRAFHVEHIVAKVHGGPDHVHNYAPSCAACNLQKGTKSHIEFMKIKRAAGRVRLVVSNDEVVA